MSATDERDLAALEHRIGQVLRIGVFLSAGTLAIGLALSLLRQPIANRVLNTGLVLLMAIPLSRILASFADALRRRDRLLSVSTAIVLIVMALTLAYQMLNEA